MSKFRSISKYYGKYLIFEKLKSSFYVILLSYYIIIIFRALKKIFIIESSSFFSRKTKQKVKKKGETGSRVQLTCSHDWKSGEDALHCRFCIFIYTFSPSCPLPFSPFLSMWRSNVYSIVPSRRRDGQKPVFSVLFIAVHRCTTPAFSAAMSRQFRVTLLAN